MSRYGGIIIKPHPDRDEYVAWSTMGEAPHFVASRRVMLWRLSGGSDDWATEHRLARADKTGTSSLLGEGMFGGSVIFQQRGTISCAVLAEFSRLVLADEIRYALLMCEPFEDLPFPRGLGHLCDYTSPDGVRDGACHRPPPHASRCWHCRQDARGCSHVRWGITCDVPACTVHPWIPAGLDPEEIILNPTE